MTSDPVLEELNVLDRPAFAARLGAVAEGSPWVAGAAWRERPFADREALAAVYRERFGFPFVIAVRGRTPASIIDALERRLEDDPDAERETALREVARIVELRLRALG